MKPQKECTPCFLRQMDIACRLAGADNDLRAKVMDSSSALLKKLAAGHNPPYIATILFRNTYRLLRHDDPYLALKKEYNAKALKFYPFLEKLLARSSNPLAEALKMALAGNIIDFGILEKFNLTETLKATLKLRLPENKVRSIRKRIAGAETILYIADNAGEIGFDYFLISASLRPRLKRAFIQPEVLGSDHCPIGIEIE